MKDKISLLEQNKLNEKEERSLYEWFGSTDVDTRKELITRLEYISVVINQWIKNPSLISVDKNNPYFGQVFGIDVTYKLTLGIQWIRSSPKNIDKYSTFIHEAAHFDVYNNKNIKILNGGLHKRFNGLERARELGKLAGKESRAFGSNKFYQKLARQNPWNIEYWASGVPGRGL